MEWTKEETLNYINTNRFFAAFNLNRISGLIGPEIYIYPPLPEGIVGLLLYTVLKEELNKTLKEELDKTSKEELDETSKEETIETSDKDETQVDSGNQQVDSGGNQDQMTDQEELKPQDEDIIGL